MLPTVATSKARKYIVNILRQLIEERRASQAKEHDMLACLMRVDDDKHKLSDEEIIDLIITLLYSGYETVSTTSMMAVKYLHDHPQVLHELRNTTL
ncbi:Cytochrome P450 85A [Ancistrocladus abbreviatus]